MSPVVCISAKKGDFLNISVLSNTRKKVINIEDVIDN
jgi:hypothetical protein